MAQTYTSGAAPEMQPLELALVLSKRAHKETSDGEKPKNLTKINDQVPCSQSNIV